MHFLHASLLFLLFSPPPCSGFFASSPHFPLFIEHWDPVPSSLCVWLERPLWERLSTLTHTRWGSSLGTGRMILLCPAAVRAIWPITHWLWMEVTCVTSRLKHLSDGVRLPMLSFPAAVTLENTCVKMAGPNGGRSSGHWVAMWGMVALKNHLDPWWISMNKK